MSPPRVKTQKDTRRNEATRWFWDALDAYLAKKNLKQTKQREIIVERFIAMETHLSAEDLHEAVRRDGHNIGLATIYRTLNLLADAGLAEQKQFGEGRYVYEVMTPGGHHDHIICIDCGAVFEFENEAIEALQDQVALRHHIKLTSHRLDLFGHCTKIDCDRRRKSQH
jgi:Fur family ferric uptake transcriptional regulator